VFAQSWAGLCCVYAHLRPQRQLDSMLQSASRFHAALVEAVFQQRDLGTFSVALWLQLSIDCPPGSVHNGFWGTKHWGGNHCVIFTF
jgi:hypothetical protein